MEGYERKTKEEISKELQDLDPIGSPHLEEKVIGENVDLDLLSFIPLKRCKKHGGNGGGRASFEGQQWRREKPKKVIGSRRKKGIYRWGKIWPLEAAHRPVRP
jgi:hypothetical protein